MFIKKALKDTKEKAENAIDNVTKDTKEIMENANSLIDSGKYNLKKAVTFIFGAFLINSIASVTTIYCCGKVIKSINRNDVLNEIAIAIRKGGNK